MADYLTTFRLIASQAGRQIRPAQQARPTHVTNTRTMPAAPQVQRDNKPQVHFKGKSPASRAWWDSLSEKEQAAYIKKHPKSRKQRHAGQHKAPHSTKPSAAIPHQHQAVPSEEKKYNIVWPKGHPNYKPSPEEQTKDKDYEKRGRIAEKQRQQEANEARRNSGKALGPDKSLSFILREGKLPLTKPQKKGMEKADIVAAEKAYKAWESSYGHMDADDLADAAEQYYSEHPEHAEADGVQPSHSIIKDYGDTDEQAEEAKRQAETAPRAQQPQVVNKFEQAYQANPLAELPPQQQAKIISKSVRGIAKAFNADSNEIIGNTYRFLNYQQINLLEEAAHDALQQKRHRQLPEKRKRLLKIAFTTIATAAGLAFGGLPVGLLCLNHSLIISGHEGRAHEIVWNCLRGKDADGKDDPQFDPNEDAVEKIVRSLKRQLADTEDEQQSEHIEDLIEHLEDQTSHYQTNIKPDRRSGAGKRLRSKAKPHRSKKRK